MKINFGSLMLRKFAATFVTTTLLSMLFVFGYFSHLEMEYNQGNDFIAWFVIYAMYIGAIILIYGNFVSIIMEYLQKKWFERHDWLYVLILGVFGLANGLLFQNGTAAIFGMIAAIVYGIFDKWLYKRIRRGKRIRLLFIIPLVTLAVCWGFLQFLSPPMPPFTKEDAITFATSGEGSVTDEFPNTIGRWEGTIGNYEVIRETSVEEIGKETYIVTFTEQWKKGMETGTWKLSYEVDRNSMTLSSYEGDVPEYS